LTKLVSMNPLHVFLWTFRRNEKDVVNLYNNLSDVMRLATGGDMLNFGYWVEHTKEPLQAQEELCKIFGELSDLKTAKKVVDIGSGLAAPSILWKLQFCSIDIVCLNINFNQLKQSIENINKKLRKSKESSVDGMHLLNATSTTLPFSNESVDRVLALESAQHIKPLENFISESYRILKKDGILTIAIPVVNLKKKSILKLGTLAMTWSSEHYNVDQIKSSISKCEFNIEFKEIGSKVYEPLANYYIKNRDSLKNKILSKYPSYIEKVLFSSLQKMKQVSETKVIDYLLIKCVKK
jgi:ubiquinone/menaquinone biosynthesis C-methylase UbiE